jgi:hypothetical protein
MLQYLKALNELSEKHSRGLDKKSKDIRGDSTIKSCKTIDSPAYERIKHKPIKK